jgi:hypothetical protein
MSLYKVEVHVIQENKNVTSLINYSDSQQCLILEDTLSCENAASCISGEHIQDK